HDVRRALTPLMALTERTGAAVPAIRHLNKVRIARARRVHSPRGLPGWPQQLTVMRGCVARGPVAVDGLRELAAVFLRLGLTAFGGPAAHICYGVAGAASITAGSELDYDL